MKKIKVVYQDCPFCGTRKSWGEKQMRIAKRHNFEIEKVSFITGEAKDLMKAAVKNGIRSMPFFTDGENFVKNLEDFPTKRKSTSKKKSRAVKKEVTDGNKAEA